MQNNSLTIYVDIGEDFSAYLYWRNQYGEPIEFDRPIACHVVDSLGQVVIDLEPYPADGMEQITTDDGGLESIPYDETKYPLIKPFEADGVFRITIPSAYTSKLVPGSYGFDMFASAKSNGRPFKAQKMKVVEGSIVARPRITKMEEAV